MNLYYIIWMIFQALGILATIIIFICFVLKKKEMAIMALIWLWIFIVLIWVAEFLYIINK